MSGLTSPTRADYLQGIVKSRPNDLSLRHAPETAFNSTIGHVTKSAGS